MKYKLDVKYPISNIHLITLSKLSSNSSLKKKSSIDEPSPLASTSLPPPAPASLDNTTAQQHNALNQQQDSLFAKSPATDNFKESCKATVITTTKTTTATSTIPSTSVDVKNNKPSKSSYVKMSQLNNRFVRSSPGRLFKSSSNENKRASLITGKPINHTPMTKRSKRYRRLQMIIYNYLERPSGPYAISYQLIMYFILIFFSDFLSVLLFL